MHNKIIFTQDKQLSWCMENNRFDDCLMNVLIYGRLRPCTRRCTSE